MKILNKFVVMCKNISLFNILVQKSEGGGGVISIIVGSVTNHGEEFRYYRGSLELKL